MMNNFHFSFSKFFLIFFATVLMSAVSNAQYVSPYNSNGTTKSTSDAAAERNANSQRNYQNRVEQDRQANENRQKSYHPVDRGGKNNFAGSNDDWETKKEQAMKIEIERRRLDALIGEQKRKDSISYAQHRAAYTKGVREAEARQIQKLTTVLNKKHIKYESINILENNLYQVSKAGKYGVVDTGGKNIVPVKYDKVGPFAGGLFVVTLNHKYGAVNTKGVEIIPCKYDHLHDFEYDLLRAQQDGKWGAFDKQGALVIPIQYEELGKQIGDVIPAKLNNKWEGINKAGTVLVPFEL